MLNRFWNWLNEDIEGDTRLGLFVASLTIIGCGLFLAFLTDAATFLHFRTRAMCRLRQQAASVKRACESFFLLPTFFCPAMKSYAHTLATVAEKRV